VQDAFTTFYEPEVVLAVVDLLTLLGWRVAVLPWFGTGKGLHVKGFQRRFEKVARRAAAILAVAAQGGVPMVGIEPAVVLSLRDEVPRALGLTEPPVRVDLLQEWLVRALAERGAAVRKLTPDGPWTLYGHCTEKALVPPSQEQWAGVFRALGLELRIEGVGCCGMSGMYGHEACHAEETRGIYQKGWEQHLPATAEGRARVVATGTSCRSQVDRFSGFAPLHPAEALVRALRG
jgi:Fe-S oxidoreductase